MEKGNNTSPVTLCIPYTVITSTAHQQGQVPSLLASSRFLPLLVRGVAASKQPTMPHSKENHPPTSTDDDYCTQYEYIPTNTNGRTLTILCTQTDEPTSTTCVRKNTKRCEGQIGNCRLSSVGLLVGCGLQGETHSCACCCCC